MRPAVAVAVGAANAAVQGARRPRALRTPLRQRPTLVAELLLACAWLASMALFAGDAFASRRTAAGPLWWCAAGARRLTFPSAAAVGRAVLTGLPMWALMSTAMMLPSALPAVRHVAANSLCSRRGRAAAGFLFAYLGVWIAFGIVVLAALRLGVPELKGAQLTVALLLAGAWQLTPAKLRCLRACHRGSPLPARGWRASAGVLRFGLRNGVACMGSCWALMLLMAAAGSARAFWMVALAFLISVEKLANRPRRAIHRTAGLLAAAVAGAMLALVA